MAALVVRIELGAIASDDVIGQTVSNHRPDHRGPA